MSVPDIGTRPAAEGMKRVDRPNDRRLSVVEVPARRGHSMMPSDLRQNIFFSSPSIFDHKEAAGAFLHSSAIRGVTFSTPAMSIATTSGFF